MYIKCCIFLKDLTLCICDAPKYLGEIIFLLISESVYGHRHKPCCHAERGTRLTFLPDETRLRHSLAPLSTLSLPQWRVSAACGLSSAFWRGTR